jgi:hypothetical protein|tara:strand:+ start:386 stop:598 length:213 start_codon:yes stop_codon:yes gene_type:complete
MSIILIGTGVGVGVGDGIMVGTRVGSWIVSDSFTVSVQDNKNTITVVSIAIRILLFIKDCCFKIFLDNFL